MKVEKLQSIKKVNEHLRDKYIERVLKGLNINRLRQRTKETNMR